MKSGFLPFRFFAVILVAICVSGISAPESSEKQKPCFVCNGSGTAKCRAPGCVARKRQCPNPCLKPNVGVWKHMNVAGHSPNELWQEFRYKTPDGRNGTMSWTQAHLGEVIVTKPGQEPQNMGKCPVCGGTMKIDCAVCKGTGTSPCYMCGGKKTVPESWTAENNPKVAAANKVAGVGEIRLKDGRTLKGKVVARTDSTVMIKTDSGMVKVAPEEIISESQ